MEIGDNMGITREQALTKAQADYAAGRLSQEEFTQAKEFASTTLEPKSTTKQGFVNPDTGEVVVVPTGRQSENLIRQGWRAPSSSNELAEFQRKSGVDAPPSQRPTYQGFVNPDTGRVVVVPTGEQAAELAGRGWRAPSSQGELVEFQKQVGGTYYKVGENEFFDEPTAKLEAERQAERRAITELGIRLAREGASSPSEETARRALKAGRYTIFEGEVYTESDKLGRARLKSAGVLEPTAEEINLASSGGFVVYGGRAYTETEGKAKYERDVQAYRARTVEVEEQAKALEELKPYKVGDSYDLGAAVQGGVSRKTLERARFSPTDIESIFESPSAKQEMAPELPWIPEERGQKPTWIQKPGGEWVGGVPGGPAITLSGMTERQANVMTRLEPLRREGGYDLVAAISGGMSPKELREAKFEDRDIEAAVGVVSTRRTQDKALEQLAQFRRDDGYDIGAAYGRGYKDVLLTAGFSEADVEAARRIQQPAPELPWIEQKSQPPLAYRLAPTPYGAAPLSTVPKEEFGSRLTKEQQQFLSVPKYKVEYERQLEKGYTPQESLKRTIQSTGYGQLSGLDIAMAIPAVPGLAASAIRGAYAAPLVGRALGPATKIASLEWATRPITGVGEQLLGPPIRAAGRAISRVTTKSDYVGQIVGRTTFQVPEEIALGRTSTLAVGGLVDPVTGISTPATKVMLPTTNVKAVFGRVIEPARSFVRETGSYVDVVGGKTPVYEVVTTKPYVTRVTAQTMFTGPEGKQLPIGKMQSFDPGRLIGKPGLLPETPGTVLSGGGYRPKVQIPKEVLAKPGQLTGFGMQPDSRFMTTYRINLASPEPPKAFPGGGGIRPAPPGPSIDDLLSGAGPRVGGLRPLPAAALRDAPVQYQYPTMAQPNIARQYIKYDISSSQWLTGTAQLTQTQPTVNIVPGFTQTTLPSVQIDQRLLSSPLRVGTFRPPSTPFLPRLTTFDSILMQPQPEVELRPGRVTILTPKPDRLPGAITSPLFTPPSTTQTVRTIPFPMTPTIDPFEPGRRTTKQWEPSIPGRVPSTPSSPSVTTVPIVVDVGEISILRTPQFDLLRKPVGLRLDQPREKDVKLPTQTPIRVGVKGGVDRPQTPNVPSFPFLPFPPGPTGMDWGAGWSRKRLASIEVLEGFDPALDIMLPEFLDPKTKVGARTPITTKVRKPFLPKRKVVKGIRAYRSDETTFSTSRTRKPIR